MHGVIKQPEHERCRLQCEIWNNLALHMKQMYQKFTE